ncbi:hypothetical protein T05_1218 [Trichinella murrelli]|uniref:Uncharacterized protein n=1 Tax=Trichinella murrelli TaxID=144512 RepID=A0A0V0TXZ8_9BILA|nr:hypothetical protein T05_1218 [Trichinella murrelli]
MTARRNPPVDTGPSSPSDSGVNSPKTSSMCPMCHPHTKPPAAARRELFPPGSTRDNSCDELKRRLMDTYGKRAYLIRLEMRFSGLRQQKNLPI